MLHKIRSSTDPDLPINWDIASEEAIDYGYYELVSLMDKEIEYYKIRVGLVE
jgi:hypothetical protein